MATKFTKTPLCILCFITYSSHTHAMLKSNNEERENSFHTTYVDNTINRITLLNLGQEIQRFLLNLETTIANDFIELYKNIRNNNPCKEKFSSKEKAKLHGIEHHFIPVMLLIHTELSFKETEFKNLDTIKQDTAFLKIIASIRYYKNNRIENAHDSMKLVKSVMNYEF